MTGDTRGRDIDTNRQAPAVVLGRARAISLWLGIAFSLILAALVLALPQVLAMGRAIGTAGFLYQQQADLGALADRAQEQAFWRQIVEQFPQIRSLAPARWQEYVASALMILIMLGVHRVTRRRPVRRRGGDGKPEPAHVLPCDTEIPAEMRGRSAYPAEQNAVVGGVLYLKAETIRFLEGTPGHERRRRGLFALLHEYCHARSLDDVSFVVLRALSSILNVPLLIFALYAGVFLGIWFLPGSTTLAAIPAFVIATSLVVAVWAATLLDAPAFTHLKELMADGYAAAGTGYSADPYDPELRRRTEDDARWRQAFASVFAYTPSDAERRRRILDRAGSERLPLLIATLLLRWQFVLCVLLATGIGWPARAAVGVLTAGLSFVAVRLAVPLRAEWPSTIRRSTLVLTLLTLAGAIVLPLGQWVTLARDPFDVGFLFWVMAGGAALDVPIDLLWALVPAALAISIAAASLSIPVWRSGPVDPAIQAEVVAAAAAARRTAKERASGHPASSLSLGATLVISLQEILAILLMALALSCVFGGADAFVSYSADAFAGAGGTAGWLVLALDASILVLGVAVGTVIAKRFWAFGLGKPQFADDGSDRDALRRWLFVEGALGLCLFATLIYTATVVFAAFVVHGRPGDMAYAYQLFLGPDAGILSIAGPLLLLATTLWTIAYGLRIRLGRGVRRLLLT